MYHVILHTHTHHHHDHVNSWQTTLYHSTVYTLYITSLRGPMVDHNGLHMCLLNLNMVYRPLFLGRAAALLRSIGMSMSVCPFISETTRPNLTKFVHMLPSSDDVVIRYALPVLCMTSVFSHNGLHGTSSVFFSGNSITSENTVSILTKFCSNINISKYTSWIARLQGQSLLAITAFSRIQPTATDEVYCGLSVYHCMCRTH